MREFFGRLWQVLREHQFVATVAAGVTLLFMAPFINLFVPEQFAAKAYIEWIAAFVAHFWREIIIVGILVALIRLYVLLAGVRLPRRFDPKDVVVTMGTPPITVALPPVEFRLLRAMEDAGGGPFDIEQIYIMMGVTKGVGSFVVTSWAHLQDLISIKFVNLKLIKNSEAVTDLADIFAAQAERRAPRTLTREYQTPYFTLSDRGRGALKNVATMANEFVTKY